MPYSSFTIAQVKRQFQLNVVTGSFCADVPKLMPGEWLINLFQKSVPLVAVLGTEKVRSELAGGASFNDRCDGIFPRSDRAHFRHSQMDGE